jgi:hypothetical protein
LDDTKAAFTKMLGAQEVCVNSERKMMVYWCVCRKGRLRRRKRKRKRRSLFRSTICYPSANFRRRWPTKLLMWVLFSLYRISLHIICLLGRRGRWTGNWHWRIAGRLYIQSQSHCTIDRQVLSSLPQ